MYSLRRPAPGAAEPDEPAAAPVVDLLQAYDEMIMSYLESRWLLAPPGVLPVADRAMHAHAVLVDGALAGYWRSRTASGGGTVDVQLRRPIRAGEREALQDAVVRYGAFLGMPTGLAEPVLLSSP